jgi:hypothetical protein
MKVITTDGVLVDFDPTQSRVLCNMIADTTMEDVLPLQIDSATLAKVNHWMNVPTDPEEPWETLKAMAQAADFLDMPDFLDRTCRRMANELKGRKPEEIRQLMDF